MKFLVYSLIAMSVLFLDYRIGLRRGIVLSFVIGVFILIHDVRAFPYGTIAYALSISAFPFLAHSFKKDFERRKEIMRARFKEVKATYEDLMHRDKQELESNLQREKNLQQILSL